MNTAHTILVILSLVLLGAHVFRAGAPLAAIGVALILALAALVVKRRWAARAVQVLLFAGSLEWGRTAVALASRRAELGEPFVRLLAILGAVALVTLIAALGFQHARIARAHGLRRDETDPIARRPHVDSAARLD
jgi:hypothetical protein